MGEGGGRDPLEDPGRGTPQQKTRAQEEEPKTRVQAEETQHASAFGRNDTRESTNVERKHRFSAEQFPVSAYVESLKNLKEQKRKQDLRPLVAREGVEPSATKVTRQILYYYWHDPLITRKGFVNSLVEIDLRPLVERAGIDARERRTLLAPSE